MKIVCIRVCIMKTPSESIEQMSLFTTWNFDWNEIVSFSLLYSRESWVTYRRHVKRLEWFHLRRILRIKRQMYTSNVDIHELIQSACLCYFSACCDGHVVRKKDVKTIGSLSSSYVNWRKGKDQHTNRNCAIKIATRTHWRIEEVQLHAKWQEKPGSGSFILE